MSWRLRSAHMRRRGDAETQRRDDAETRNGTAGSVPASPRPRVPVSPRRRVSLFPSLDASRLRQAIQRARACLLALQQPDGHWVGELEGDTILESEHLLLLQ